MKVVLSSPVFKGMPDNYTKIDDIVSRSAQPKKEDFKWLKEQGVTDIFNFRTMYAPAIDFSEQETVETLGMKYHNIPSVTKNPKEENVSMFLNQIEEITANKGKAHIHCKAGADRTGMYSFIYKMIKGIGTLSENKAEWLSRGHNTTLYPNLMQWAEDFVKKIKLK